MLLILLMSCYGRVKPVKSGFEGKPMPVIDLLSIDSSTHYSTKDISEGKPTLLFAFETWCPYCKAQTQSLISNPDVFKDVNIYMVCNSQFSQFRKFYNDYKLSKYSNIKIGIDYNHTFANYFKSADVPYMAVYDKNKNLKEIRIGKTSITTIKKIALN